VGAGGGLGCRIDASTGRQEFLARTDSIGHHWPQQAISSDRAFSVEARRAAG